MNKPADVTPTPTGFSYTFILLFCKEPDSPAALRTAHEADQRRTLWLSLLLLLLGLIVKW